MRAWFDSLNRREQVLFSITALTVIVAFYFLVIWEPLSLKNDSLRADLENKIEQKNWMSLVSSEVNWIRSESGGTSARTTDANKSLLAIVDSAGRKIKLGSSIKQIQPDGDTVVRVRLEDAPFEKLINWLEFLNAQFGIVSQTATIEKSDESGMVSARISLKRAAAQ